MHDQLAETRTRSPGKKTHDAVRLAGRVRVCCYPRGRVNEARGRTQIRPVGDGLLHNRAPCDLMRPHHLPCAPGCFLLGMMEDVANDSTRISRSWLVINFIVLPNDSAVNRRPDICLPSAGNARSHHQVVSNSSNTGSRI